MHEIKGPGNGSRPFEQIVIEGRIRMKHRFWQSIFLLMALALVAIPAKRAGAGERNSAMKPVRREDQLVAFHTARAASRPYDADAWRMLAGAYVARAVATGDGADYNRAWEMLAKAESLDPGDIRILQGRAGLLLSRHHFQEARRLAEKGLEQSPNNPELLGIAGDGALETGDLDAADRFYQKLNVVSPRLTSWARLAHLAEMRGNLDESAEMLERALEAGYEGASLPEARAWCRAVLGEMELHRGNMKAARGQYEMGLKESPNHLLVLEHFAEFEQTEGNLAAAETDYRKILAQREDPKAELHLAAILETIGDKREAGRLRQASLRFYERAVASGNEGYLRTLAVFELAEGHYERAASLQLRDVALRPTPESRGVLQTIQDMAAAAGKPLAVTSTNTAASPR